MPEPSGALGLAGLKSHIFKNNLQGKGKRFVAIVSGANVNFGRMKFVADRAELGERREVLMSVVIPEVPGGCVTVCCLVCSTSAADMLFFDDASFLRFHSFIHPRAITEFAYRVGPDQTSTRSAPIFVSFLLSSKSTSGPTPEERQTAVDGLIQQLKDDDVEAWDLSNDEMSKDHVRYMLGGKTRVDGERAFMFGASHFRPTLLASHGLTLAPSGLQSSPSGRMPCTSSFTTSRTPGAASPGISRSSTIEIRAPVSHDVDPLASVQC